ncbi:MAG TPA: twin-arginine translocation signal domain-containing protein, partial [Candidatus Hydrogenedentes bacterium]|nr:twin-arginine translocation signal domain-containing protein [Candidatus Hydrogenedentota bacterium]
MNRREFLGVTTVLAAAGAATMAPGAFASTPAWPEDLWNPDRAHLRLGKPLRVQPVLMYRIPVRREMASWKSWGGIQTEEAAGDEVNRITAELAGLASEADFAVEMLPVARVTTPEEATKVHESGADATIVYPATGSGSMLQAALPEIGGLI